MPSGSALRRTVNYVKLSSLAMWENVLARSAVRDSGYWAAGTHACSCRNLLPAMWRVTLAPRNSPSVGPW